MRILIKLSSPNNNPVNLPISYNHLIQSLIYATLDNTLAEFLHNTGYEVDGRRFKLFTFSRLIGNYRFNHSMAEITYIPPINLVVSSPVEEFCQSLLNGLLTQNCIRIGSSVFALEEVKVDRPLVIEEWENANKETEIRVKTLSPIVVYSTFLRPEGSKYTCYFEPGESDFSRLINENLSKKYKAIYGNSPAEGEVKIKPLHQPKLQIIRYKNFIIKGYSALLSMSGPASLLQVAIDAGLGAKNSMGFGLLEVIDKKDEFE
ncbi:MAG TPA: CRISPR-associated endoribonuclease Cas6 [Tissierellaceae bacterium]